MLRTNRMVEMEVEVEVAAAAPTPILMELEQVPVGLTMLEDTPVQGMEGQSAYPPVQGMEGQPAHTPAQGMEIQPAHPIQGMEIQTTHLAAVDGDIAVVDVVTLDPLTG